MYYKSLQNKKRETEIYEKIRDLSETVDRLKTEGKDTTEAIEQVKVALDELGSFRRNYKEYF